MAKAIQWSDLELVKVIGEGRAGKVWLAKLKCPFQHLSLGTSVAVKCYKSWVLEEPGQFERIIRELELGRRIQHPNLVRTLSIIRDPDGKPALVMAYYPGKTLEDYLDRIRRKKEPLDLNKLNDAVASGETWESYFDKIRRKEERVGLEFAFKIVGYLASAISTIHKAGAIHRDIKPANIILNEDYPVLMDFGVIRSDDFPEQTTSGSFLGTIRYAAPEYLFGENYNSSIDVYALGAIAFELFENSRFPSEEEQWARLILEKNKYDFRLNSRALKSRYGLNATEFIKFIIDHTLAKAENRTIDMNHLVEIINKRLWEKPFHIADGVLIEGEPNVPHMGGHDEKSKAALCTIVDDIRKRISVEDRILLHQLLEREYFTYYKGPYPSMMFGSEKVRLVKVGCLKTISAGRNHQHRTVFYIHDAIIAAYRYGYLSDAS